MNSFVYFVLLLLQITALIEAFVQEINEPNHVKYQMFHHMERHIPRESFVRGERSPALIEHEVFIAVHQNNLPDLKKAIIERATPGHPLYQKWFTFHEMGAIVQNEKGYGKIKSWLEENDVKIIWVAPYKEYIKATASIATWEKMLKTEFYQHEDLTRRKEESELVIHRASEYSIPLELKDSIDVVFHTVQTPPRYHARYGKHLAEQKASGTKTNFRTDYTVTPPSFETKKKIEGKKHTALQQIGDDVDIAFLNSLYQVNSNIASSLCNQSVFETSDEYFSPADLNKFQTTYHLTVQSAISVGDHSVTTCGNPTTDSPPSCGEGNLDLQYIMGMAQKSGSIFWWVPTSGDPFVNWINEVVAEEFPPQSNSISWGELEIGVPSSIVTSWETEAMKLAGRGVTISVASGDNGASDHYTRPSTGVDYCMCSSVVSIKYYRCYIPFLL
jgi:tripeptidyl-peptidase-1